MAVKSKDDINTQLSTGGSAVEVERDLVKDIVDSYVHADDVRTDAEVDTLLEGYVQELAVAVQADSVAADLATLVADFNALLAKLKAANVMASS